MLRIRRKEMSGSGENQGDFRKTNLSYRAPLPIPGKAHSDLGAIAIAIRDKGGADEKS